MASSSVVPEQPLHIVHIEIDVSLSAEPISGTVHIADVEREFVGWLELINVIEDTRDTETKDAQIP